MSHLLVVTENGLGKRVALTLRSIPSQKKRGARGTLLSSLPVAAVVTVTPLDEVLIATEAGKVQRIAVRDVPVQGRRARGSRIISLKPGDRVATCTVASPEHLDATTRTRMTVALRKGERLVLLPLCTRPSGSTRSPRVAVGRAEWSTEVHAASSYCCGHCGHQHPDPHAVYGCIDRHRAESAP
jgi:DNA gyrase/topoisomerase IV subunit A